MLGPLETQGCPGPLPREDCPDHSFPLVTASQGRRGWCKAKEPLLWESYCFLSDALSLFPPWKILWGWLVARRKTRSSWSHILRSIFYLTSGQRALTLMAKNVVSLFSGSTKAPFLKRWGLQSNRPSRWGLRWKQRMQGGCVRGHSPSYGTNTILLSFSHNPMMWFLLSTPFYRQWAKS